MLRPPICASLLIALLMTSVTGHAAISDAEAINRAGMQRMLGQR